MLFFLNMTQYKNEQNFPISVLMVAGGCAVVFEWEATNACKLPQAGFIFLSQFGGTYRLVISS